MEAKKLIATVVMVIVAFAAGFTGGWYLKPEAEKPPATIICLTWGSEWGEATAVIGQNFTSVYGNPFIVDYHTGGSMTAIAKLDAQWPNPKFDMLHADCSVIYTMAKNGWLAELNETNCPSLKDISEVNRVYYNGKCYGAAMYVITNMAVAWRTDVDLPGTPIVNWSQLLDPRYKGMIVCGSQTNGGSLIKHAYWSGADPADMDEPGWIEPGVEKFETLAETGNIGMIYATEADALTAFASGDCPIFLGPWDGLLFPSKKEGVEFASTHFFGDCAKVAWVGADGIAVINGPDAEKVSASIEFANMFLNSYNNGYFCSRTGCRPTNKYAEMDPLMDETVTLSLEELELYGAPLSLVIEAISTHREEWLTIWETEIAPLLG